VCKTITDLQILGCKLHQNAFGGQALPGPAGGVIALSQTPSHYYYYYYYYYFFFLAHWRIACRQLKIKQEMTAVGD